MERAASIVFVVDDDASIRESLDSLIRCAGWRSETFASAYDFLARPPVMAPSCLILDVDRPEVDWLALQRRIAADRAEMPIIFITGRGDVPLTVQAMKGGAFNVLAKPLRDDVLLRTVQEAIEQSSVTFGHEAELRTLRLRHASLSQREREVMAWVTAGRLNKQIGNQLGISEITVKTHRGRVMRKMEAASLADLVTMAAALHIDVPRTARVS